MDEEGASTSARRTRSFKKLRENSWLNVQERDGERERASERSWWIKESVRFLAKGGRVGGWEGASCHRTATPTVTVGPQSSAHPRTVRTVVLGGDKLPRRFSPLRAPVVQGTSHIARFSWRSICATFPADVTVSAGIRPLGDRQRVSKHPAGNPKRDQSRRRSFETRFARVQRSKVSANARFSYSWLKARRLIKSANSNDIRWSLDRINYTVC